MAHAWLPLCATHVNTPLYRQYKLSIQSCSPKLQRSFQNLVSKQYTEVHSSRLLTSSLLRRRFATRDARCQSAFHPLRTQIIILKFNLQQYRSGILTKPHALECDATIIYVNNPKRLRIHHEDGGIVRTNTSHIFLRKISDRQI